MKKEGRLILALIVFLCSCSKNDNHKVVKEGQEFTLSLCAKAAEGYELYLINQDSLKNLELKQVDLSSGFFNKSCCCGVYIWRFLPTKTGKEFLNFQYSKNHPDSMNFEIEPELSEKYLIEIED